MKPQLFIVIFLFLLGMHLGFAQADHNHDEHESTTAKNANVLELGDTMLELNPMLLPDGQFYLGFRVVTEEQMASSHDHSSHDHESEASTDDHSKSEDSHDHANDDHASDDHASDDHASDDHASDDHASHEMVETSLALSLTSPSGNQLRLEGDAAVALSADMGMIEEGMYTISGSLGEKTIDTSLSVYYSKTDLESDVYVILAPSPSLSGMGLTEAFVYAFSEGENIHTMYLVNRKMPGMTHITDEEELELSHNHFDAFRTDDFEPAGNDAPIGFPMVGDWEFTVSLMSSVPEIASVTVTVLDQ